MPRRLAITVFIDACGWDVVEPRPWFLASLTHRQPARSVLGYSSACVPTILSGLLPSAHEHFAFYRWAPESSPFARLGPLRHLPSLLDRAPTRRWLSAMLRRRLGYTGYFQLYAMPFEALPSLDWTEKRDLFEPGGLNRGSTIFDALHGAGVPYHRSDWQAGEDRAFADASRAIDSGEPRFAFVYCAALDGVMHTHGKDPKIVDGRLELYQARIERLVAHARSRYDEVRVAVVSDHGMADVQAHEDLMARVARTGLRWGVDYAAVFDSTMARLWFLKAGAEERIRGALGDCRRGRFLPDAELAALGAGFADRRYGEAFFLLDAGVLACPSHLGRAPLRGMHGYHPDHEDSHATLLASFEPERPPRRIDGFRTVMDEMCAWATAA